MKVKTILLTTILFLLMISFVSAGCFRMNVNRGVSATADYGYPTEAICVGASNCSGYDAIFPPGRTFKLTGIGSYNWACDDGVTSSGVNYANLWEDRISGRFLASNSSSSDGTTASSSSGSMCYQNGPCYLTCEVNSEENTPEHCYQPYGPDDCGYADYGAAAGSVDEVVYQFNTDASAGKVDVGEMTLVGAYARLGPAGVSPYSSSLWYGGLGTYNIFVGSPSLLVFGQEGRHLAGTPNNTDPYEEEITFTLMNKSMMDDFLLDYNIVCGDDSAITCSIDQTYKNNAPWTIGPGNSMFITGSIKVEPGHEIPREFEVYLEVEFKVDQITNCPGTGSESEVVNCNTQSFPSTFQIALEDEQDFQIEMKGSEDQTFCVGPEGVFGQTGPEYAPKVNVGFGGDSIIEFDECDTYTPVDTDGDTIFDSFEENDDWVYCSQKEFMIELAEKIDKIITIKENVRDLNAFESQRTKVDAWITEQALLSTFEVNLRGQELTDQKITTAISELQTLNLDVMNNVGLSNDRFPSGQERYDKLESLLTNIEYSPVDAVLAPGKYRVSIDLNELADEGLYEGDTYYGSSDMLFPFGSINQTLQLKASFQKISDPEYDWFFYEDGGEDLTDDIVEQRVNWDFFKTNVQNRGIVLEFSDYNGDINAMYPSYAVPMFVKIEGDANGETDAAFGIAGKGTLVGYESDEPSLSVWSGFASSLGDGCSDIVDDDEALPYRILDTRQSVREMVGVIEEFKFDEYVDVQPNQEMFLQTILYVPMASETSGQSFSLDFNSEIAYTKDGLCDTGCVIQISDVNASYMLEKQTDESMLQNLFDKIDSEEICVYLDIKAAGKEWMMYWNTEKMIEDIATVKQTAINDSTAAEMCEATIQVA